MVHTLEASLQMTATYVLAFMLDGGIHVGILRDECDAAVALLRESWRGWAKCTWCHA
jgi:hypothetical protein